CCPLVLPVGLAALDVQHAVETAIHGLSSLGDLWLKAADPPGQTGTVVAEPTVEPVGAGTPELHGGRLEPVPGEPVGSGKGRALRRQVTGFRSQRRDIR